MPTQSFSTYGGLKAALNVLTKTAAKELGPKGIRVNAVSPGYIPTDMNLVFPQEIKEMVKKITPLGRVGTTEEVAHVVAFLAGPQASWVNGQIIDVAGGI